MFKNYLKIAWRNFTKNKAHSAINIIGLSVGMAVSMLIGLWIHDELSYNKNFPNYNRIAQVMQHQTFNGDVGTQYSLPYLMGAELKKDYSGDFKYICMASWNNQHVIKYGDKLISRQGNFMEPAITEMLSLKMIEGARSALKDYNSILLSSSSAKAIFGNADPMNQVLKIKI